MSSIERFGRESVVKNSFITAVEWLARVVYTNLAPDAQRFFRGKVWLK